MRKSLLNENKWCIISIKRTKKKFERMIDMSNDNEIYTGNDANEARESAEMVNSERKDAQVSGRTTPSRKEWVDAEKEKHGGFDAMIAHFQELSMLEKLESSELPLATDMLALDNAVKSIQNVLLGIKGKAEVAMSTATEIANSRIDEHLARVEEYRLEFENVRAASAESLNAVEEERDYYKGELQTVADKLNVMEEEYSLKCKEKAEIEAEHAAMKVEAMKLNALIAEQSSANTVLNNKINSLQQLEEENKELKVSIDEMQTVVRELKAELNNKTNTIESKDAQICRMNKDYDSLSIMYTKVTDELNRVSGENMSNISMISNVNIALERAKNENNELKESMKIANTDLKSRDKMIEELKENANKIESDHNREMNEIKLKLEMEIIKARDKAREELLKTHSREVSILKDEIHELKRTIKDLTPVIEDDEVESAPKKPTRRKTDK